MKWLQSNVFDNIKWLMPNEIIKNINPSGHTGSILKLQNRQLFSLLNTQRLQRMMDAEVTQVSLYKTIDMFRDLRNGIFSEVKTGDNVIIYRRNIQKSFIEKMSLLMKTKEIKNSDLFSIIRGELIVLKDQLTSINNKNIDLITRYHYNDCLARIKNILNPNK
jgi:translation elongation factor EF-Tu-like GTPase